MSNTVSLNLRDAAPDLDLRQPGGPVPPRPARADHHAAAWIVAVVLFAAAGAAGYYAYTHGSRWQDLHFWRTAPAAATPPAAAAPLGGTPEAIEVPPLDVSDPVVRTLVHNLSANPEVAAWLMTDGLIRNFTAFVADIAEGRTPARYLLELKPAGLFTTAGRGGRLAIDPRSYDRYNGMAAAAASIDAQGAARLYATLKARIEEAHRELGTTDPSFDQTLQRAIAAMLETPSSQAPLLLRPAPHGIGYMFRDPTLENLTGAQKQLLRMGPANVSAIQSKLREIATALGLSSSSR